MLDETEFLSDYGVRALSKWHLEHPFELHVGHVNESVRYTPAESESRQFGGNSNWRGPIWFPLNFLIIESLQKFHHYYGDDFKVECPTGSGQFITLEEVAAELAQPSVAHFPEGRPGRSTGPAPSAAVAAGPLLPRLHSVLRILSRRQRPRRRRLASIGLDFAHRQAAHAAGARLADRVSLSWQAPRSAPWRADTRPLADAPR